MSDVNVTYKRAALEQTRHLWQERYQEPVVHWALTAAGETLYLSPELVVHHHLDAPRLGPLLPQRFAWGRLFGAIRARHSSTLPGASPFRAESPPFRLSCSCGTAGRSSVVARARVSSVPCPCSWPC